MISFEEFVAVQDFIAGYAPLVQESVLAEAEQYVHRTNRDFTALFNSLQSADKKKAQQSFHIMQTEPRLVELKPLQGVKEDIWQAKIGRSIRALAERHGNTFVWYFIGTREMMNNWQQKVKSVNAGSLPPRNIEPGSQSPLEIR